jgi:hypothetical protein
MTEKLILDACCGGRMFWFDKQNPLAVFCDNRTFSGELCDGRTFVVNPDVVADFTALPFDSNTFRLVVFDPPHILRGGDSAWMVKKYGRLPTEWESTIRKGFDECMRVLDTYGILVFKWCEIQIPLSKILQVVDVDPLFGHKSGRANKTHWLCFIKTQQMEK